MSETAALSALAGALNPANSGAIQPTTANGAAFQAVVAALGYGSAQTTEQLEVERTASLGHNPDENGNIVPLVYLNGMPGGSTMASPRPVTTASGSALREATTGIERGAGKPHDATAALRAIGDASTELGFSRVSQPPQGQPDFSTTVADRLSELRADVTQVSYGPKLIHTSIVADASAALVPTLGAAPSASVVFHAEAPFPLHHARFAQGLSQQITVMASDGVQLARITINPPDLGPVELRIVMRNEEAAVQLASQHGVVRDTLEEALPRLREQFEQAGMRLADSGVFSELPSHSANHQDMDESIGAEVVMSEPGSDVLEVEFSGRMHRGFVDAYV